MSLAYLGIDCLMTCVQPPLRIAIAHSSDHPVVDTDTLAAGGVKFLMADAVEDLTGLDQADAVVIDYGVAGASEFIRGCPKKDHPPVIALVGRDGPCRTMEQSLLRAEADGAALALPKPAGPAEIAIAALQVLDRRSPEAGWRIRLHELLYACPV